jgi:[glutamine synthetase] adenylyltransferase / [glutamine synthetase]-adenylyl-L-tyrosine phosphorylase
MGHLSDIILPHHVPGSSDPEGQEKLQDFLANLTVSDPEIAATITDPSIYPLFEGIFGNSPFLSQCITKDPAFALHLIKVGPEVARDQLFQALRDTLPSLTESPAFMREVRIAKRHVALLTAIADIGGIWPLETVTQTLSDFADIAVDHAVAHLLHQSMSRGDLAWPGGHEAPALPALGRESGYFVLAMGKLGGGELNYSSDIDLICFFEHERVNYTGRKSVQDCLVRLTQGLVKLLQERTGDGYVFRVDLRLRPDAGATPACMSTEAAEIYYQSMGLNWERSAMIKARTMAGDMEAGDTFMQRLQPFIWRKNLDFAALDDIRAMKERIHEHHGHGSIGVAGQDVKLGPGGIREIEFYVQSQQLISGGRMPVLRGNQTVPMLDVFAEQNIIEASVRDEMQDAYYYLRRLEHRLQMVRDEQTHTMPTDPEAVAQISVFMGYDTVEAFGDELCGHLAIVHGHFNSLFSAAGEEPEHNSATRVLLRSGDSVPEEGLEALSALGFKDPQHMAKIIVHWGSARYRACRSERSQGLLNELLPAILQALASTSEPDQALIRFDEFLSRLPSGVQMFSLFQSNPKLLDLLAQIIGSAPPLAAMIGRSSALFDAVLDAGFFAEMPDQQELQQSLDSVLSTATDFQDVLDITRRWVHERKFQIGVKTLQGTIDADDAFAVQTDLAEVSIRALYPAVCEAFATIHGVIPNSDMATIAMGSFGGVETSFTSDLDIIFVYSVDDLDLPSDGAKPLSASQYYTRLSQRFINSITAQTSEGRLYEVDMRLRPSGNAGPIALSLEAFETYQQKQAWTWEHMALSRARIIIGPDKLREKVSGVIKSALSATREPDALVVSVADMRKRLASEFSGDNIWQVKHVRGGLVDVEFIAQYLQLRHAAKCPEILNPRTTDVLATLEDAALLSADDAACLIRAAHIYGAVRGFMRQCMGEDTDPTRMTSADMREKLAQIAGAADIDELEQTIRDLQASVMSIYTRLIEDPANAIEQRNESNPNDNAGDDRDSNAE